MTTAGLKAMRAWAVKADWSFVWWRTSGLLMPLLVAALTVVVTGCGVFPSGPEMTAAQGCLGVGFKGPENGEVDGAGPFRVARVVDGDTVWLSCPDRDVKVRLVGVDAPETVKPNSPVECGGPEASAELHHLLDGQEVYVVADTGQGQLDKYGRQLAYLWYPGKDGIDVYVNLELVSGGFARAEGFGDPYYYEEDFVAAEKRAHKARAGLWSCPEER